jgi:hypothetical protein
VETDPMKALIMGPPGTWLVVTFKLVVGLVMAWCLYSGYLWARVDIPVALVLGGVMGIVQPLMNARQIGLVITLPLALGYIAAALVLWTSANVSAYFQRRDQVREGHLSLMDGV